MRNAIGAVCLGVLLCVLPLALSADTAADIQAQIAALLAQIKAMQDQIVTLQAQIPRSEPLPTYPTTVSPITTTVPATVSPITTVVPLTVSTVPAYKSCTWNGQTIPNGATVTAYQYDTVPAGSGCAAQLRGCTDGTLSGTYQYASCTVAPYKSCTFNGKTIPNGGAVTAYENSSVPAGKSCVTQLRGCGDGTLSGTYQYASCSVAAAPVVQTPPPSTTVQPAAGSCTFDGKTVSNGQSVEAYSYISGNTTCSSLSRTCLNGVLTGAAGGQYIYSKCPAPAPTQPAYRSCSFNGQTIQNGGAVTAYQSSSVPAGQQCAAQLRGCGDGTLSGTYQYTSCTPASVASPNAASEVQALKGKLDQLAGEATKVANAQIETSRVAIQGRAETLSQLARKPSSSALDFTTACGHYTAQGGAFLEICNRGRALQKSTNALLTDTINALASWQYPITKANQFAADLRAARVSAESGDLSAQAVALKALYEKKAKELTALQADLIASSAAQFKGVIDRITPAETQMRQFSAEFSQRVYACTDQYGGSVCIRDFSPGASVPGSASCAFKGQTIAHLSGVQAYKPISGGTTCQSEYRSCFNGVLSGSYPDASCTVAPPAPPPATPGKPCTWNGSSVADKVTVYAYNTTSAPSCGPVSEARVCHDGALSGSYQYATCQATAIMISSPPPFTIPNIDYGVVIYNYTPPLQFSQTNPSLGTARSSGNANQLYYNVTAQSAGSSVVTVTDATGKSATFTATYEPLKLLTGSGASCTADGYTVPHLGKLNVFRASTMPAYGCTSQGYVIPLGCVDGKWYTILFTDPKFGWYPLTVGVYGQLKGNAAYNLTSSLPAGVYTSCSQFETGYKWTSRDISESVDRSANLANSLTAFWTLIRGFISAPLPGGQ